MKTGKRLACLLITLSLMLTGFPSVAYAADVSKEEVVYGLIGGDGSIQSVYVVNTFELAQAGEIVDYGSYETVSNLTTTDELSVSGDTVRVSAPEGRFYYQGNLGVTELPWKVSIGYTLDGRTVSAEELAGQSGALAIHLQIEGNPNDTKSYADHYALQVTVTLDMERCTDIAADGATLANSGSNKLITLMGLPGEAIDCTITATVHDFEMSGIQIAGVPLSLALDNLKSDELDDQLSELTDGLRDLDDGVGELYDGVSELKDGTSELHDGVAEMYDGVVELYDGSVEFCDGIGEYRNGLAEYLNGVIELGDGIRQAASGTGQLVEGLGQLAAQSSTLQMGAASITEPLITEILQKLNESLGGYLQGTILTKENYTAVLDQILPSVSDESMKAQLTAAKSQLDQIVGFYDGIVAYTSGVSQIAQSSTQLSSGLGQAADGIDQLIDGGDELYDGTWELEDGAAQLRDGVGELVDGVAELASGTQDLDEGVVELYDGVGELKDGTGEIREKVTTDEIEARIEEMLDDYTGGDFDAPSFVSEKNEVSSVQFVLMTKGISLPEAEVQEVEEEPESFWDRLLALFGL